MKVFPKTLYVKRENGGTDDEYLNPAKEVTDLAEMGAKVRVGVYVLKEVVEIKGVVVTTTVRDRK